MRVHFAPSNLLHFFKSFLSHSAWGPLFRLFWNLSKRKCFWGTGSTILQITCASWVELEYKIAWKICECVNMVNTKIQYNEKK